MHERTTLAGGPHDKLGVRPGIAGVRRAAASRSPYHRRHDRRLAGGGDTRPKGLLEVLAPDVTVISDGGGVVAAARKPIIGAEAVAAFLAMVAQAPDFAAGITWFNGMPGIRIDAAGEPTAVSMAIENGRINRIYAIRNPDKLRWLNQAADLRR